MTTAEKVIDISQLSNDRFKIAEVLCSTTARYLNTIEWRFADGSRLKWSRICSVPRWETF